ncbi:MAG: hypothetical protein DDT35_01504 [Firmicutes bacterium]|nr:hypothetical protein [Bacillota bacterium]
MDDLDLRTTNRFDLCLQKHTLIDLRQKNIEGIIMQYRCPVARLQNLHRHLALTKPGHVYFCDNFLVSTVQGLGYFGLIHRDLNLQSVVL